jgi:DNA-binding NarL/FixJ family response regulator
MVVALSMHSDGRFVLGMLRAGASGYLLKDCAYEELTTAIRTVMAGQTYLSPDIASVVRDYVCNSAERRPGPRGLTPSEREVLQLVVEGKGSKEIAHILHLSVKTVESHRRQIAEKLGMNNVADLTKFAIREGITPLEP